MGRKRGSRNAGYFFRKGRGWVRKINGRCIPLLDPDGNHLKDPETLVRVLNDAYERSEAPRVTIRDLSNRYLKQAKISKATYAIRLAALTQFCNSVGNLGRGRSFWRC